MIKNIDNIKMELIKQKKSILKQSVNLDSFEKATLYKSN